MPITLDICHKGATQTEKISNYSCFFGRNFSLSALHTETTQSTTKQCKGSSNVKLRCVKRGSQSHSALRNKEEEEALHLTRPLLYFWLGSVPQQDILYLLMSSVKIMHVSRNVFSKPEVGGKDWGEGINTFSSCSLDHLDT